MTDVTKDRKMKFTLENDVKLTIDVFEKIENSPDCIKFIYEYVYRKKKEDDKKRAVEIYNKIRLIVDYINGIATKCCLSMYVVFPERLGKISLFGADVSRNAKKRFDFIYEKEEIKVLPEKQDRRNLIYNKNGIHKRWRMVKIEAGIREVDLTLVREGEIMKQINFPFTLKDVIEHETFLEYRVPFPHDDGSEKYFSFADSIVG